MFGTFESRIETGICNVAGVDTPRRLVRMIVQSASIKEGFMHAFVELSVPAGRVGVHWFEQSSFALKNAVGTTLLIDPYFPLDRPAEKFIHGSPPVDVTALPARFVLLTHSHDDHTHAGTIAGIEGARRDVRYIGPAESIEKIMSDTDVGGDRTNVVGAGDALELDGIMATAVLAKPSAGDPQADIAPPDVTHLGYVLDIDGVKLYFSGDPINTFADNDELVRAVADLAPEVGFLTTHPTEGEFPGFDGSIKTAVRIGLKTAVPSHYACFVKRNYDPDEWASGFPADGPEPLIIPRNSQVVMPM